MEKHTPISILDAMKVNAKESINGNIQSYRNAATALKQAKNKQFIIKNIGGGYQAIRLL